jgi:hypothetical protein
MRARAANRDAWSVNLGGSYHNTLMFAAVPYPYQCVRRNSFFDFSVRLVRKHA